MNVRDRLLHELKSLGSATLFFGAWIGILILIKTLILEEYRIGFTGWTKVVVGALVLSKVVIILEHVSLGTWLQRRPAWVDVVLRTSFYSLGVAVVLVLEHAFRERHEGEGLIASMAREFRETGMPHVIVNTICLSGALLVFNALVVVRRHLGSGGLLRLFLSPPPEEAQSQKPDAYSHTRSE